MRTLLRRRWLLVSGVAVVACGLVAVLLWPRSDGPVSRARCERVQIGMTQAEVEAVLGGPPGSYRTGTVVVVAGQRPDDSFVMPGELLSGERPFRYRKWQGDDGTFRVFFDTEDRVVACQFAPGRRLTLVERVRVWLGL